MAGGEYQSPNEYGVVYLWPQALASQSPSGANLLSVVANVGIYSDSVAAVVQFKAQGRLDRESIERDIREAAGNATQVLVEPLSVELEGVDQVRAFRLGYGIGPISVTGYRYRFIVANSVANVIVTGRPSPDSQGSSTLRALADGIAKRQVSQLNEALR